MVKLKTKLEKEDEKLELPLASLVIQEYKLSNQNLRETLNSIIVLKNWLIVLIIVLVTLLAIETTYIIVCWDLMQPYVGAIRKDVE